VAGLTASARKENFIDPILIYQGRLKGKPASPTLEKGILRK